MLRKTVRSARQNGATTVRSGGLTRVGEDITDVEAALFRLYGLLDVDDALVSEEDSGELRACFVNADHKRREDDPPSCRP